LTATIGDAPVAQHTATIATLSAAQTQALLARMEPLPNVEPASAPITPPASAAPARDGHAHAIAFFAPSGKTIADKPISKAPALTTPLEPPAVLPVGEVKAESEIRVRFAEAMVPVAAVGKVGTLNAKIDPPVAGTWRWIDTRVAQFTASATRLPGSTQFTVTIAAGTRAVSAATLMSNVTATFSTQPVKMIGTFPGRVSHLRPDSPVAVEFDQDVDATAIAKRLQVQTEKKQRIAFQLTTLDAAKAGWAKNPSLGGKYELAKHVVLIAPKTRWPSGTISILLAKGAPSREGPRTSDQVQNESFIVVPPFTAGISCYEKWSPHLAAKCPASWPFTVQFSNDIDKSTYRSSKVQIVGEPFEDNSPNADSVSFDTLGPVGRTFEVAIGDGLKDIYGQDYVGAKRLSVTAMRQQYGAFASARTGLFVLDPRFEIPQWIVSADAVSALRIQLYQVRPQDYFAFLDFEAGKRAVPPGKKVYEKQYSIGARNGATARVDLRPALSAKGMGHVIAVATVTPAIAKVSREDRKMVAWIQVSKLGITARIDHERVNAWTQDISASSFLKPIPGVKTSLVVEGRSDAPPPVITDAEGHAAFDLLPKTKKWTNEPALLLAQTADDAVFSAINGHYEKEVRERHSRWYVTDDRFTYKPGETVYVKGWLRWTHTGPNPDLSVPTLGDKIDYSLVDSRGNKITSGKADVTPQGGFDVEVALPANANLGMATFTFTTNKQMYRHPISIEEFRTPAFSVSLDDDVASHGVLPLVLGENIEMAAEAKYYAGGGLAGSRIDWNAALTPASYAPPGWDRFTFSPVRPRAGGERDDHAIDVDQETSLSGASTSAITLGISALPHGEPAVLTVDARVTDIDRQSIRASSRPIVVHPSALYVGLRAKPRTLDVLEAIVTDIDGNAVAGVPVEIAIEAVLPSESSRNDAKVIGTQSCKPTSAREPVPCTFHRESKYEYTAVARVKDSRGRANASQLELPYWTLEDADLMVKPDRKSYKPGDVAKLEVFSRIAPAVVVVSFARQGVIVQKRLDLAKNTGVVELPIEKAYVSNIHVLVDRWGKRKDTDPKQAPLPDYQSTEIVLPVELESARLEMRVRPNRPLVEPGAQATFEVEVKHDGKPVAGAEVALMAVDEAVLALANRSHADPLASFYAPVAHDTFATTTLDMVWDAGLQLSGKPGFDLYNLDETGWGTIGSGRYGTIGHGSGSGSGYGYGGGSGKMFKMRKDFRANAAFSPKLLTDARGKVRLTVKMPENLTRFRIVALATAETYYFGKAESTITTQRLINARTVAPRFLTQGDAFSLPIIVQNLGSAPRTIDVVVRAANLNAIGAQGKRLTVPAGQRAEVRFDFATKSRGRAVIQTAAVSGSVVDASNVDVPVYEPATTESFATYGIVDGKAEFEQLAVPRDIYAEVGGVETEVASTQLQSLTDAYWYLQAYPFECAEQRSSRMLATAALADVLEAFAAPDRPSPKELASQSVKDVDKLARDQNEDGGWGYFSRMESDPFVTQQVLAALAVQKTKNAQVMKRATAFVTTRLDKVFGTLEKPDAKKRPTAADVSLAATSLATIATTKTDVRPRVVRLHQLATTLGVYPVDAKARVLALLAKQPAYKAIRDKLLAELLSSVHETSDKATVAATFDESERLLLVSNNKTTALVLDAIMREAPQHPLIVKLARGLLEARTRGRWMTTQENLTVLQAMRRYFDTYEKVTPNYTGKIWVGTAGYVEHAFTGHTNTRVVSDLDWSALAPGSTHEIALAKMGPGRMYYRIGITYAPKKVNLPPLDAGFVVRRSYRAADDPKDVVQLADGRWKIKLGARVIVQLETINTTARHAVALVDPLPAGLESVNTRLATAERAARGTTAADWDHLNMRDTRSEAFAMELAPGSHQFSYTARATTPGAFVAAPAKAEEMYSPETFGRSAGATVVIE